jgi:hypothetical protein
MRWLIIPLIFLIYRQTTLMMANNKMFILEKHNQRNVKEFGVETDFLPYSVKTMMTNVYNMIRQTEFDVDFFKFEFVDDSSPLKAIYSVEDVTYMFVEIDKARKGTFALTLQYSSKHVLRLVAYATNTVHHGSDALGTTVNFGTANKVIDEYLASGKIRSDAERLLKTRFQIVDKKMLAELIKNRKIAMEP